MKTDASTPSTRKQVSLVSLQEHQLSQTRTPSSLQKRIQSIQTAVLQKTETSGGKASAMLQRVRKSLTGTETKSHVLQTTKTPRTRQNASLTPTHALQLLQNSVLASHQTGKIQRVFRSLQSSLVDAARQQYLWYTRHAAGTMVYSLALS